MQADGIGQDGSGGDTSDRNGSMQQDSAMLIFLFEKSPILNGGVKMAVSWAAQSYVFRGSP